MPRGQAVWIALGLLIAGAGMGARPMTDPSRDAAPAPPAPRRPVIIAHRGASGYVPEHTLEGVAMAHAMGADFIEQDLILSRDGVPVVLHDLQLDAVTDVAQMFPTRQRPDGHWYALDLDLAELKTLTVHERTNLKTGSPQFPGRVPQGQGTFRIPTLEEELELIAGLNRSTGRTAGIYPEMKAPAWHRDQGADLSAVVLPILARHGYATKSDPCYVQCFEFAEVRRIRNDLGYQGRLIQLLGGGQTPEGLDPTTAAGLDSFASLVDGIGPSLGQVFRHGPGGTPEPTDLVALAHARGMAVHPYTVRADALPPGLTRVEDFFRLIFGAVGVDGVFTDHPDRGVQAAQALGR